MCSVCVGSWTTITNCWTFQLWQKTQISKLKLYWWSMRQPGVCRNRTRYVSRQMPKISQCQRLLRSRCQVYDWGEDPLKVVILYPLRQRFSRSLFVPMFRARELEKFRTDPACFVLLLGKKGAHGLDLSFVTHMFLMDQIWDRSLETQVKWYNVRSVSIRGSVVLQKSMSG